MRTVEIVLESGRAFVEDDRLSPIGLVVSEHVDKIALMEPGVEVVEKEVFPSRIRFVLRLSPTVAKPVEEIARGYRIGCFRIAREYRLVTPGDPRPIFTASDNASTVTVGFLRI